MMNKKCDNACHDRLGKVGGQAVLEGVMMKAGDRTVTTCRKGDNTLVVSDNSFTSIRKKHKFFDLPIIRGIVSFVESMVLSVKTLGASADALEIEEEPSKFEKWLEKKFGANIIDVIMVISVIIGLGLSVLLFVFLPIWISAGINALLGLIWHISMPDVVVAVLEGFVKMGIFIAYLSLVSFMPDIKRTFMYHGAEHKSIACFEAGAELTPENAKNYSRFHPRCGTSFMFFMILLGIFAGLIIKTVLPGLRVLTYTGIRLLILPLLMGLGYEVIRLAGKYPNPVTNAISAPGLWVQRITTKEPTEDMLEVAITSLKCALRDDYPEFAKFYEDKAWETKPQSAEEVSLTEENEPSLATDDENTNTEEKEDISAAETTQATESELPLAEPTVSITESRTSDEQKTTE